MSRPAPGQRSVGAVVAEAATDVFGVDGTLRRTLATVARQPGALTLAYARGESEGLFRPTRLYLLASVVLFAFLRLADPGAAAGRALLDNERAWLASGNPKADAELVADLGLLERAATVEAGQARARAEHLSALAQAVRDGRQRAEAAEAVAPPSLLAPARRVLLSTENTAVAQGELVGTLLQWLPLALIALVPLYAFGLHLAFGRGRSGVVALVLAAVAHAVAYVAAACAVAVAWALGWGLAALVAVGLAALVAVVWQVVAARHVFGVGSVRAWIGTLGIGGLYLVAISVAFAVAYVVSFVVYIS